MQQLTDLRRRVNSRGQWVQLGVLSASVLAPLVSRWNDLRAAERARALRAQAQERLQGAGKFVPWNQRAARQQLEEIVRQVTDTPGDAVEPKRSSSVLWLIGAGVGLVAAGAGAYVLVRRQMRLNVEEPLVELPVGGANGHAAGGANGVLNGRTPATTAAGATAAQPSVRASAGAAGPTPAGAADGAMAALADSGAAPEAAATEAVPAPAPAPDMQAYTGMQDAAAARFIGNIHTMIFHEADADTAELPAEENRIYFLTEDEARAAGFRRDRDEVAPSEAPAAE